MWNKGRQEFLKFSLFFLFLSEFTFIHFQAYFIEVYTMEVMNVNFHSLVVSFSFVYR